MLMLKPFSWLGLAAVCISCSPAGTEADRPASEPQAAIVEAAIAEPISLAPPAGSRDADATADIVNRAGDRIGSADLYQGTEGVVMRIAVTGLTPGAHGMHFHAIGTCEDAAAGFKATGGHVMPFGKPHGYMHPDGPHAGNLPNLIVGENGTATVEIYSALVSLFEGDAALLDEDGSTLIIHENEDDHVTQPIGGAGGRAACGVIESP